MFEGNGLLLAAGAFACCLSVPARAAYVVNIEQVGNDVIATGGGSIDAYDLVMTRGAFTNTISSALCPGDGFLYIGNGPSSFNLVVNMHNDNEMKFGYHTFRDKCNSNYYSYHATTIGPGIGFSGGSILFVPVGYVSGRKLKKSVAIWRNVTFESLGLMVGSYVLTWGAGGHRDSFTVNILNTRR